MCSSKGYLGNKNKPPYIYVFSSMGLQKSPKSKLPNRATKSSNFILLNSNIALSDTCIQYIRKLGSQVDEFFSELN